MLKKTKSLLTLIFLWWTFGWICSGLQSLPHSIGEMFDFVTFLLEIFQEETLSSSENLSPIPHCLGECGVLIRVAWKKRFLFVCLGTFVWIDFDLTYYSKFVLMGTLVYFFFFTFVADLRVCRNKDWHFALLERTDSRRKGKILAIEVYFFFRH